MPRPTNLDSVIQAQSVLLSEVFLDKHCSLQSWLLNSLRLFYSCFDHVNFIGVDLVYSLLWMTAAQKQKNRLSFT